MKNWVPVKKAAEELKLTHLALLARVRRGTVKAKRVGWNLFIPRTELDRLKREQAC